jgi:hypothetical protein
MATNFPSNLSLQPSWIHATLTYLVQQSQPNTGMSSTQEQIKEFEQQTSQLILSQRRRAWSIDPEVVGKNEAESRFERPA